MLNNCGKYFKYGQFRWIKCIAANNHHINQIKNKPQDLLVMLAVQPGAQLEFY